jgi:putative transferase (TIGR04331 family)
MGKKNYIVSNIIELWDDTSKEIFISDPYVKHVLDKEMGHDKFYTCQVAKHIRKDATDLEEHDNFVDEKYQKYMLILSERLDKVHERNYGKEFWQKALSLGLVRYITSLHNSYSVHEKYFDDTTHFANILSTENYFYPDNFEDLRHCLQNSDYGQEIMFSMYLKAKGYKSYKHKKINIFDISKNITAIQTLKKQLKYLYFKYLNKTNKVAILGSYFKKSSFKKLESHGINQIILPHIKSKNKSIDKKSRKYISEIGNEFDEFDRYFFFSLEYLFPKIYIENFTTYEKLYKKDLHTRSSLKYIVCENFISNSENSLYLALANIFGIKHIANEHNCFYHPYIGSYIKNIVDLCDKYLTIGWSDDNNKKVISSSSLFKFKIPVSLEKDIDLLFISGSVLSKMQHYSGAYGYCQENAESNINFNKIFLSNLNIEENYRLVYREYPKNKLNHLQTYDKEFYYLKYLDNFDYTDTSQLTSKEQISKSKLVLIDYISTSFIESLLMEVPTIFFLDKESYYLKEEYSSFFDDLIDANICQTNPIEAANFVNEIFHDPNGWWNSITVQTAKENFISKNLNTNNNLIDYLKKINK